MTSVLDQLSDDSREDLVEGVSQGEYHLLFGAGSGPGSQDADGDEIPLGNGLTNVLKVKFGLRSECDLALAYDRAVRNSSKTEVYRYLRAKYTSCTPAPWIRLIPQMVWKGLWTLNVDDTLEQAYLAESSKSWQNPRSYSWDDLFAAEKHLQLVHLHGHLLDESPRRLVFGISEYLDAREEAHTWHRAFGDTWTTKPFIVLGARLLSEYDLAKIFRAKRNASDRPSFYVARSIDDDTEQDLREWGLEPIRAEAKDFINELHSFAAKKMNNSARVWSRAVANPADLGRFATQFKQLLADDPHELREKERDFYQGDQPIWEDIVRGRDAPFAWVSRIDKQLTSDFDNSPTQGVHLILGPRFSGRTVGVLRIAYLHAARGRDVFLFRQERRLDAVAAHKYLQSAPAALLIFDGLADFADDLHDLVSKCQATGTPCQVLATEYEERARKLLGDLTRENVHVYGDPAREFTQTELKLGRLSRQDAVTLVDHLIGKGRIGKHLKDLSYTKKVRNFTSNDLFSGLAQAEFGSGFRIRVSAEVRSVKDPIDRRLLASVCMLHSLDLRMPLTLGPTLGLSAADCRERTSPNNPLGVLLSFEGDSLMLKHRRLTLEPALELLGKDGTYILLRDIANDLARFVNRQTRRQRTLPVRIIAGIMRARTLESWIGASRVLNWYEDVYNSYKDDSRFWEQRALAAEKLGNWAASESFAVRACSEGPGDTWRLNTLGKICLRRAANDTSIDATQQSSLYQRGCRALKDAYDLNRLNGVPIDTYLVHAGRLVELALNQGNSDLLGSLSDDWQEWLLEARGHSYFNSPTTRARIDEFHASFLKSIISGIPEGNIGRSLVADIVPQRSPNSSARV